MKSIFTGFLLLVSGISFGQITQSQEARIDSLFVDWQKGNHPGGVIGVMKGDQWLYRKTFGNASLEFQVPIDFDTRFNVASVSKQFTAMGIIKLHLEGRLALDDSIQKYLPEIPVFEKTITIRQLLHHTSGLRSLHGLLEMAGWKWNNSRTKEDLFRLMMRQEDLNFVPGTEYGYSNTGYVFLAEIIERVTGTSFEAWTAENILKPLGLKNSFFEEDYTRVHQKDATSYAMREDGFHQEVPFWGYVGAGNMHSTLDDLMAWYGNFVRPARGWSEAFEFLQVTDKLTTGEENNYAMGIVLDEFQGQNRIQHSGGVGGYRSFACIYPDQDLRIVVLTNFASSDPAGINNSIAEVFLPVKTEVKAAGKQYKPIKLKSKKREEYIGFYWNPKNLLAREIRLENDTLWYVRSETNKTVLIPVGDDLFLLGPFAGASLVKFNVTDQEKREFIVGYESDNPGKFDSYVPPVIDEALLQTYVGKFFSPELQTTYEIKRDGMRLYAEHIRLGTIEISVATKFIAVAGWPLGTLEFKEDGTGQIVEFTASNGKAQKVRFVKINNE